MSEESAPDPMERDQEGQPQSSSSGRMHCFFVPDDPLSTTANSDVSFPAVTEKKVAEWSSVLKKAAALVGTPSPVSKEPFKNINEGIERASVVNFEVDAFSLSEGIKRDPGLRFWVRFAKVHVLSCLAKWYELCEELGMAEINHTGCLEIIERELGLTENAGSDRTDQTPTPDESNIKRGKGRMKYMYIYELTRYAILRSERDDQAKALQLLKKAEAFYHDNDDVKEEEAAPIEEKSMLGMLDSLNSESTKDMFTYVLFYIGQAYKIAGEKEKALFYLHMVLRRQFEKGDYNHVTWGSDTARLASVLMVSPQALETARNVLVAATTVMKAAPEEEKSGDNFRQNWADLGRTWGKLGVNLLEYSAERLRDLEDSRSKKQLKFQASLSFDKYEKLSLEISADRAQEDTVLIIRGLKFPKLDISEADEVEMKGRFVRDFDEARAVFLPSQRWLNTAKEYYNLEEYAGDYIDVTREYAALFKQLIFFEPSLDRRIKMEKRRIAIFEELLSQLNSKVYTDVFHEFLRELAEAYEAVYKLKVDEYKDRGKSLRPKDKKLVQWLVDAVAAHKRNLQLFNFDLENPDRSFPEEYEKILVALVLAIARILGSICHDHPLHDDAAELGEESKKFYKYFLGYLDRRIPLKQELYVLHEGSQDMPELLDSQIRKIRHHHRMRSAALQ